MPLPLLAPLLWGAGQAGKFGMDKNRRNTNRDAVNKLIELFSHKQQAASDQYVTQPYDPGQSTADIFEALAGMQGDLSQGQQMAVGGLLDQLMPQKQKGDFSFHSVGGQGVVFDKNTGQATQSGIMADQTADPVEHKSIVIDGQPYSFNPVANTWTKGPEVEQRMKPEKLTTFTRPGGGVDMIDARGNVVRTVITDEEAQQQKGDAAIKIQKAKDQYAAQKAIKVIGPDLDSRIASGQSLLDHPGLAGAIGKFSTLFSPITSFADENIANFKADLDSFLNDKILNQLTEIKRSGATLGQITERELEVLKYAVVSLRTEQGEENFKKNLRTIIQSYERIREDMARQAWGEDTDRTLTPEEWRQRRGGANAPS